jgi:hypothetical protein
MYPFKIQTYDPELQRVLRILGARRAAKIPNRSLSIRLGIELSEIRQDVFVGSENGRFTRSFIALSPGVELDIKEHNNRLDAIFKKIF